MSAQSIANLVKISRSRRRFHQDVAVEYETLEQLVDLARLSPSSANLQPLRYILSCDEKRNGWIFSCLSWAGYLKGWSGPEEGERPSAYIVILGDTHISNAFGCDHGIAAQSIMLGAVERGLGGCIMASVNRERLRRSLAIPDRYEILLVLALGKPEEEVVIESVGLDGDIKYWRDESGVHHVPKRALEDIILE
ncbi:MAG: nitroreductase family protein [Chloroflexota bacterium]|nr:nitroreductase family protein [Chloroflexota bacterium]